MDAAFFRFLFALPFTPLPLLWFLTSTALLCFRLQKVRTARRLALAAIVWLLLISTGPIPNLLIASLEDRYDPLLVPPIPVEAPTYIVVLGAGHSDNPALPLNDQLSETELARLVEGIRLQRRIPGSVLVTSGARGKKNRESQATVARKATIEMGLSPEQVDTLSFTANTRDEAQHFHERFGPQARLILVTDAVHLPRAIQWFRKVGLAPVPAPTNFILKYPPEKRGFSFIPNSSNIEKMEKAMHEYLGLLWLALSA